ncbi:hypothetical protein K4G64_26755, partial [Streptomyces sp. WAC04114]|nr:hypothetical protein [Streptomyces sp. WAC04114]
MNAFEAVRLLLDRAAGSAPAFRLTARNRQAVAQLCLRLDGIPLAIELASVRLSAMTAEEILERLDDRFRLLSMPRPRTSARGHHTLRGIVDWSYDLCTEGERLLWNRLSVFSGGFDLEAAETVCAGEGVPREDVLDLLAGLVDKSIVAVNSSGERARYSLLETIRQYGRQRLQEEGGTTRLRVRHSAFYRMTAVRAGQAWCGPREVDWLVRLRTDLPNLRTALDYCASRPDLAGDGLEIAVNLARTRCWFFSSTLGEGRHWLERLLATGDPSTSATTRAPAPTAGALAMKAWIALCQGDNPAAETFLAECRAVARELPDGPSTAPVTYIEGAHAMLVRGDPASRALLAEARSRFRAAGQDGDAAHGDDAVGDGRGVPRYPRLGLLGSGRVRRRGRGERSRMGPHLGPVVLGTRGVATRRSAASPGAPAAGPGAAAGDRGQLGSGLGPGDTGVGGGGHRRRHPRGVAPRRRPPHAPGHGGGADRPAPVPRGAPRRRATGARVPGSRGVRGGLVPGRLRRGRPGTGAGGGGATGAGYTHPDGWFPHSDSVGRRLRRGGGSGPAGSSMEPRVARPRQEPDCLPPQH